MNSSYATDMFSGQFGPATYQPGPARINRNRNPSPSNVAHPAPPPRPSQHQALPSRPHSIEALAEHVKQTLGEDPRSFNAWLRIAQNACRDAKSFQEQGDLESAFVEYAKAALIVLEKIPTHPDYRVLLSTKQRGNLGLHGQEILDYLAKIKSSNTPRYSSPSPSTAEGHISFVNLPDYKRSSTSTEDDIDDSLRARRRRLDALLRADQWQARVGRWVGEQRRKADHGGPPLKGPVIPGPITTNPFVIPTRPHQDKLNKVPIPVTTTTSLSPQLGTVQFPSLMSQHQNSQGYHPSLSSMFHNQSHPSHSTPHNSDLVARNLKTVYFPHDCLNRFTSIASINTAKNIETCGLLLGNDKDGRYVVTTLLIPRQHATSDTCVIDEEELVMQFTEGRSLITLGWIHTHPTHSCLMSSIDLHTHSGFQRLLPESFAVVCAPKSTPNFGIFRLTDPPGLQTILQCSALEAIHPHPDRPIYTDADVQICGLPLEIVDLREHTASESESADGLIALRSHSEAVALASEDTLGVVMGSLSGYRHFEAGHDGEQEEEDVVHAPRTAGGHNEPISELETPKQRPVALQPKTPAQRGNVSHKSTLPSVNHSDGLALPTDTSMQSEAANPTPEVFEGFDLLHRPPEFQLHDQQPEYLRILRDKFGTPRPDRGNRHSFTDYNSSRNEGGGNYRESFVDPDNESSNVRCSVKTVSKGSLLSPNILSPVSSQLTSRFN